MAGKGGGAWKVAYADFVTAMMAFFLVMWIVAQNKPAVKESIAKYFTDPYGTSNLPGKSNSFLPTPGGSAINISGQNIAKGKTGSGRASQESSGKKAADETDQKSRSPGKAGLQAINNGNPVVGTMVSFDDDTAELSGRAKQMIDELLPELLGKTFKIEVRGHASGRPLSTGSTFRDPWELSYARGVAVMKYLTEKGVQPRRFRLSQGGAFEPNLTGHSEGIRAPQSRVEVYALNELAYEPTISREEQLERLKPQTGKRGSRAKKASPPVEATEKVEKSE